MIRVARQYWAFCLGTQGSTSATQIDQLPITCSEGRTILSELAFGNYAVAFDGTPYRFECFGVGIRFIVSLVKMEK